jgi:hypothetical protein
VEWIRGWCGLLQSYQSISKAFRSLTGILDRYTPSGVQSSDIVETS